MTGQVPGMTQSHVPGLTQSHVLEVTRCHVAGMTRWRCYVRTAQRPEARRSTARTGEPPVDLAVRQPGNLQRLLERVSTLAKTSR